MRCFEIETVTQDAKKWDSGGTRADSDTSSWAEMGMVASLGGWFVMVLGWLRLADIHQQSGQRVFLQY